MTHTISVHKITLKYLSAILAISLLGLFLVARTGWMAIEEDKQRHQHFEIELLQRHFSELFSFYQGIAQQLSKQVEVADILVFSDQERAVVWAKMVRELIPESIGVALVDSEGAVMGEPLQLNLGTQCVSDLQRLFAGQYIGSPPVHRSNPELSHFDITQNVMRDGEIVGVLFISFSLDVIKQRVAALTQEGQILLIEDGDGEVVALHGDTEPVHHQGDEHPRVIIENTDWKLHYMGSDYGANKLFASTLVLIGLFLVATIVLMVWLTLKLITLFKRDLALIQEQLSGVYEGERNTLPSDRTVLTETRDIMDDVWQVMGAIEQANANLKELSVNDELSGLLNRRGFNEQLDRACELSRRGGQAVLVLLDLDFFKQVNDTLGHGMGDKVIVTLAQALRERCRKSDIIARLGGDEFAVILNATAQQESVEQWYHQLAEHFSLGQSQFLSGDVALACTISAGAVPLDKALHGWSQKQLEAADRALYQAKESGRGRIVCHFPKIRLT